MTVLIRLSALQNETGRDGGWFISGAKQIHSGADIEIEEKTITRFDGLLTRWVNLIFRSRNSISDITHR